MLAAEGLHMRAMHIGLLLALTTSVATGHTHEPAWMDAPGPLYAWVTGPVQVRGDGEASAQIHIINLSARQAVLGSVTLWRDGDPVFVDAEPSPLPPTAHAAADYREAEETLHAPGGDDDRAAALALMRRQGAALETTARATRSRTLLPGADLAGQWSIEIAATVDGSPADMHLPVHFERFPRLPNGTAAASQRIFDADTATWTGARVAPPRGDAIWLAGDQHLHTTWSLDAHVLNDTVDGPAGYADAARARGLDWIMITDHSNIHAWWFGEWFFTPEQHETARQEAASYRDSEGWPVLYSQEMGLGRTGFWDLPAHMLVYPLDTFDAPYLENPSDGLVFGHAECEDEQIIIDRINDNGCYGFIAHPYDDGDLSFAQWDWSNGATGWAGLELWSNAEGLFQETDLAALSAWHDLLADIAPPSGGTLADRPGFPTRAPVGLGNSDAHEPGAIGSVFTYGSLDSVTPDSLRETFLAGRCIASDGPLLTIEANQTGIGDVALLPSGAARVVVRLETTSEFGPISDYTLVIEGDGEEIMTLPTADDDGYAAEFVLSSPTLWTDATYLTAWAQRSDLTRLALTNPVWLQHTAPGDVDGSGAVTVDDMLALLGAWGPCEGCPADADWNGIIDVNDVLILLANWG